MRILDKKRRVISVVMVLSLCLTAMLSQLTASAAPAVDTSMECSLTVKTAGEFDEADTLAYDVELYRVAVFESDGTFTAQSGFAGVEIGLIQTEVNGGTDAATWAMLAEQAAEAVDAGAVGAAASFGVENGIGSIGGLIPGLYLVCPQSVVTERYLYESEPVLVFMPFSETREDGNLYQNYNAVINAKFERSDRYGSIEIIKTLDGYNNMLGDVSFGFKVTAVLDGEVVYSNVVSLTFGGAGTSSAVLDHIPATAHVTVEEIYCGPSYSPVGATVQETDIVADGENGQILTPSVSFENTYNGGLIPNTGVVNHFEVSETDDGIVNWTWVQQPDCSAN